MRRYVASALATVVALVAGMTAVVAGPASPARAAGHDPIVFVHGFWGADWNWTIMRDRFEDDGWSADELFAMDYSTGQSNVTTANQLAQFIDEVRSRTGHSKVDVVTHSMGGLSSRYYIKFLGGGSKIDDLVSLGGPNHGTYTAYVCWTTSCGEMRPESAFLNQLNAGDETPGAVNYATVWSSCDEIVNPDTSALLAGAVNQHLSGCIGHASLLASSEAYTKIRDFVR
jgi:triacylglycerol lipase